MRVRLKLPTRALDALWLLALAVYILAGMPAASFHGDEAMQIYMSHDYVTAFIERDPARLMVTAPYYIDEDAWLRILNGSVNRHAIGLSWHLAGFNSGDLPPRPGWDWGLSYERNVETDHRPPDALLNASRLPSALLLAFSAWLMFGIGWQLGGRWPAWFISGLYTLHPALLLNGRRAMMEGSLLFFGLLAIFAAVLLARALSDRPARTHPARAWLLWLLLAFAGGLTLASKHSGAVFVAGAWGWVLMAALIQLPARRLPGVLLRLAASGGLALALFFALSPALWNNPSARLRDLVEQRAWLIEIQVAGDPLAPTTLADRLEGMLLQPFMTPPAHFEVASWAEADAMTAEISAYMASPLSGLQFGLLLGLPLTLLAGCGLAALVWPRLRPGGVWLAGLLPWALVTAASLLVNPLPWQRYYLPWLPVVIILAGLGLLALARLAAPKREESPVARPPESGDT